MTPFGVIPFGPVEAGAFARMTGADAKVYGVICAHVRRTTWQACPGVARMAELAGLSERAVKMAVARLSGLGLLTVAAGGGRGNKSVYQLAGNGERPFTLLAPETVNAHARNGERRRTKRGTPVRAHKEEQLLNNTEQGAAAPPAAADGDGKGNVNGAAGRLVGRWFDGFRQATGQSCGSSQGGKLAGVFKRLLADCPEAMLTRAVSVWFGKVRDDYGVGLFKARVEGGNAELVGRPVSAGSGRYTPAAPAPGTDYSAQAIDFGKGNP